MAFLTRAMPDAVMDPNACSFFSSLILQVVSLITESVFLPQASLKLSVATVTYNTKLNFCSIKEVCKRANPHWHWRVTIPTHFYLTLKGTFTLEHINCIYFKILWDLSDYGADFLAGAVLYCSTSAALHSDVTGWHLYLFLSAVDYKMRRRISAAFITLHFSAMFNIVKEKQRLISSSFRVEFFPKVCS